MRKLVFTLIAAAAAAEIWAIQGTIITETGTSNGDIKWQARKKQYVVSIKKGQTMVDMELKLEDVTQLDIPKPAAFDKAVSMVENGQGSAAAPILSKIVAEYRMLQWDKPAARYLVMAYLAANQAEKAYSVASGIVSEDKTAAYTGDLAAAYWQVLHKLGKKDQLESLLKKAAESGDRASSAAALVMRGDMIVAGCNDAPEGLKQALRDGYLRVVLMYNDAACQRERAEAMLKAAACFDKLGQAARAEKLRSGAKSI